MKNKIIEMFGQKNLDENNDQKYSDQLQKLIKPFEKELTTFKFVEDIFDFAISAWNFGNLKELMPPTDFNEVVTEAEKELNYKLLTRMIDYKVANFKNFTNFIVDYHIEHLKDDIRLKIVSEPQESYLENMMQQQESGNIEDFDENYIDRHAIVLKPRQPFIDWYNNLYPEEPISEDDVKHANTYLVDLLINDMEGLLKKKYDKFFRLELEDWHDNKKEWPQNRSYKMFNQWFTVLISENIYDLEKNPVVKG